MLPELLNNAVLILVSRGCLIREPDLGFSLGKNSQRLVSATACSPYFGVNYCSQPVIAMWAPAQDSTSIIWCVHVGATSLPCAPHHERLVRRDSLSVSKKIPSKMGPLLVYTPFLWLILFFMILQLQLIDPKDQSTRSIFACQHSLPASLSVTVYPPACRVNITDGDRLVQRVARPPRLVP